jgi:hypothetical protein
MNVISCLGDLGALCFRAFWFQPPVCWTDKFPGRNDLQESVSRVHETMFSPANDPHPPEASGEALRMYKSTFPPLRFSLVHLIGHSFPTSIPPAYLYIHSRSVLHHFRSFLIQKLASRFIHLPEHPSKTFSNTNRQSWFTSAALPSTSQSPSCLHLPLSSLPSNLTANAEARTSRAKLPVLRDGHVLSTTTTTPSVLEETPTAQAQLRHQSQRFHPRPWHHRTPLALRSHPAMARLQSIPPPPSQHS